MTERQQNVAPRARRPAAKTAKSAKAPSRASAPARRRRSIDFALGLKIAAAVVLVAIPLAGVYFFATSNVFTIKRVLVEGTSRTPAESIEKVVYQAAGKQLLRADLDAVRKAVAAVPAIQDVTVARVLPDTIRVKVTEREPAVVVRLSTGQLAWADTNGRVVSDFDAKSGEIPPPLTGYEDGDTSDRAAADNRDRIASYAALRDALAGDKLWDWIDEVNLRYPKDIQVRLVDGGVLVRLGADQFRERLSKALLVLDAAKRGDADALARMSISESDAQKMIASPDIVGRVDATPGGKVTIAFRKAGGGDAGRN